MEKYWLITYIQEENDEFYGNGIKMPQIVTKTTDESWEYFVSRRGIKKVLFLKEITKEEWEFQPF